MAGRLGSPRSVVAAISALFLTLALVPVFPGASAGSTVHVFPGGNLQAAIDSASPGDTVLIHAGTYGQAVDVRTPGITIAGEGMGVTILDGNGLNDHAIRIHSDSVSVRDLTIRNYRGNGVFYADITGFFVDRVATHDNGPYGVYAIRSSGGWIRDSIATGHSDSGFYIGETDSCACILSGLVARNNLLGYSGTGASHITITDSLWEDNAAGIVPNVLPSEPKPQMNLVIINNVVRNNNNDAAAVMWHFSGFAHVPSGLGIVIAGGTADLVKNNLVTGHNRAGVAVAFLFMEPNLNKVIGNTLDNPGPDILWDEGGVNNCFEDNKRLDGSPATFDAGPVWAAAGALPDCSTPNAGAPSPLTLRRLATLIVFGCEPEQMPDAPCHTEF